jgi:hypothetical protein
MDSSLAVGLPASVVFRAFTLLRRFSLVTPPHRGVGWRVNYLVKLVAAQFERRKLPNRAVPARLIAFDRARAAI